MTWKSDAQRTSHSSAMSSEMNLTRLVSRVSFSPVLAGGWARVRRNAMCVRDKRERGGPTARTRHHGAKCRRLCMGSQNVGSHNQISGRSRRATPCFYTQNHTKCGLAKPYQVGQGGQRTVAAQEVVGHGAGAVGHGAVAIMI